VYGVRDYSNLILFHAAVQFSERHLLKRLSFFWFASILFNIFEFMFFSDIGLSFSLCVCFPEWFCYQGDGGLIE